MLLVTVSNKYDHREAEAVARDIIQSMWDPYSQ